MWGAAATITATLTLSSFVGVLGLDDGRVKTIGEPLTALDGDDTDGEDGTDGGGVR